MADETISTRIVANADFSNLIADVHKVTASLSKLQEQLANSNKMLANQIAVMNRSFSDTLRSTGQFSTHFVSLQSDVEKFGKNLDGGKLKLNQYFNTFRDHVKTSGGVIRDLAKQQVALQNAVLQPLGRNAQGLMQFNVHVPRGLDTVKNKTAIARQELQIMNKVIQDGAGQLINWGKNTQWAGRQLTVGLTVPLAAFGKAAADAFRMADQELVRLTKVYGDIAGTSADELGRVRDEVAATSKELASAMGVNFRETIGLAADIAATGKTGQELLGSLTETTRLAVLGEVDRQEAMKATLAIQSAFKQNTEELSGSINFLNAVENQTSTTLNDLVEAIPKAGPVIKGLGGNVQDLALYLTAMREGGISASEGANALKSALASLINPTDVAVAKFQGFGIDLLGIVNKNAGNVTGTLFALQAALDQLDPLQKQQAIEQLFGKFQFSRLNALFENLGRQGSQTLQVLDLMKASAGELEAVATRELAAVTESASGKYRRALEGLKAELAAVGEQFLTINTVLINAVDKVIEFFNRLPGPVKQALTFFGGLTAVAGPLIMLTGVLANFVGYIIKGIGHMKAFFKGGEGWKYLTPEMLAAQKAGALVENQFYSDAKAASVLQMALKNLIDEFSILEAKAKSAMNPGVGSAVTTMAGNAVTGAGPRIVDPNHPLVGQPYTRASTHMNPRAGMTEEQRMQQTMFGFVPGAIPVNRKIGDNPQIYMNEPLPPVPGLTQVSGVSTGVVASEAAKWHAMMGTLAMQSKAEVQELKKQIATTGTVSADFMQTFDDILPAVSALTDNAARQSAAIVAELRAGKLNVEQARAEIMALNAQTEAAIGQVVTQQAALQGRSVNLTQVPTLDQPVVDPTGKSNMRELFKKSKTSRFINRIAGALGVRTSGAGYNIETTRPKKFNLGNIVPGTGNQDTVPALLTPGEFVVNKEATQRNLPQLMAINNSTRSGMPGRYQYGNEVAEGLSSKEVSSIFPELGHSGKYKGGITLKGTSGAYLYDITDPGLVKEFVKKYPKLAGSKPGRITVEKLNAWMKMGNPVPGEVYLSAIEAGRSAGAQYATTTDQFLDALVQKGGVIDSSKAEKIKRDILRAYRKELMSMPGVTDKNNPLWAISNKIIREQGGSDVKRLWNNFSSKVSAWTVSASEGGSRSTTALSVELDDPKHGPIKVGRMEGQKVAKGGRTLMAHAASPKPFLYRIGGALKFLRRNNGGMIPGYNSGGEVLRYQDGGLSPFRSGFQSTAGAPGNRQFFGSSLFGGGDKERNPMAGMAVGMGMGMAGSMVGGGVGTAIQFASIIPMLAPNLLGNILGKLGGVKKGLGDVGGAAGLAGKAMGLAFRAGPLLAVTGALAGIAFAIRKIREEQAERNKEEIASVGITKKMAEEAKLKNLNLSDSVKKVTDQLKLQRAAGLAAYEAYTQSGVPQLTLTIKELKAAQKEARETMKDSVELFNDADPSKVVSLAKNLKTEYLAAGMSVEEATNKIYAIISVSNKANQAVSAIANEGFVKIMDAATAADAKIKMLSSSFGTNNAEAFASGLDSLFTLLDQSSAELANTKDEFGDVITEAEALTAQFDKLSSKEMITPIGQSGYDRLIKVRPELDGIINKADTVASIYAKWRLLLSGVVSGLEDMTAEQAKSIALYQEAVDMTIQSQKESGKGVLGASAAEMEKLSKITKKNSVDSRAAFDKTKEQYQKEIDLINKKIKKINEEAEARKKALQDQQKSEDIKLEIQKAQLDYQNKVAAGDMTGAAQAQLRIKQLLGEQQTQKALDAIEENRAKRVKELEDLAEKKNKAMKGAEKAQANIQSGATKAAEQKGVIEGYQKQYEDLIAKRNNIELIKDAKERETQRQAVMGAVEKLAEDIAKSGKGDKAFAEILKNAFPGLVTMEKGVLQAGASKVQQGAPSIVNNQYVPGGMFTVPGDAQKTFAKEAEVIRKASEAGFDKLAGGPEGNLKNLIDAVRKGPTAAQQAQGITTTKEAPRNISTNVAKYGKLGEKGLSEDARNILTKENNLVPGDYFTYSGQLYKVAMNDWTGKRSAVRMANTTGRATFGRVVPGRPYIVGERGPEALTFDLPGKVGPKYNIPAYDTNQMVKYNTGESSSANVINMQIIAQPGMDVEALGDYVINKLGNIKSINRSKSGGTVVYGKRV